MKKVLITGATGNIGKELIKSLSLINHDMQIFVAVRDLQVENGQYTANHLSPIVFDFTNINTYSAALHNMDIVFLLRPPQISEVEKYFKPLIAIAKDKGVKHIIFLSVQGVEDSRIIPHHKIEELIVNSRIFYTFLRPAYFMQNFTTSLNHDLLSKKLIYLPAGDAKFTIVDVADVGRVAAEIITHSSSHINKAYELTSHDKLTFSEMAQKLSIGLGEKIQFKSPNLFQFFISKKKDGLPVMLILVMIMLHYLPRFKKEPSISNWVVKITGKIPSTFDEFITNNIRFLK